SCRSSARHADSFKPHLGRPSEHRAPSLAGAAPFEGRRGVRVELPNFTAGQRKRLVNLGVLPEQIEQLRVLLPTVKRVLQAPPGRNATMKVLDGLSKHAAAMIEVEQRYWKARPDDIGPSSAHNVIPRLTALADAARDAAAFMPPDQARRRTGSGRPIRWIDEALQSGWAVAQGQREVRIVDGMEFKAGLPPYPDKFHPHESGKFIEIVAVCYEAAGAPPNFEPLAAIRAYVRGRKRQRDESLAVTTEAIRTAPTVRKPQSSARRRSRQ